MAYGSRLAAHGLVLGAALTCVVGADAPQIFWGDRATISFAAAPPADFTVSGMETVGGVLRTIGPVGPGSSRDFWFRTQPLATGPSWRPPGLVRVDVSLQQLASEGMTQHLHIYARYSTDRVHWSSWHAAASTAATDVIPTERSVTMTMPRSSHPLYDALMSEWWKTNPPWSSDEQDFCEWLARHHRDYFDKEIPAMGWVQVLGEGSAQRLQLSGLDVRLSGSAGGLSSIPRGKTREGADGPWTFDLSRPR